jgi:hypothetical protein
MVEPLREFFVRVPGLKEVGGRPVKVVRGKDRVVLLTAAQARGRRRSARPWGSSRARPPRRASAPLPNTPSTPRRAARRKKEAADE